METDFSPTAPRQDADPAPVARLRDQAAVLVRLGWPRREAEWLALVCLHGGVFLRSQYLAFIGRTNPALAHRFVRRCRKHAVEEPCAGSRLRVCRIASPMLYELLGAEHARHRRPGSPEVVLRRLLSLDYVLEHPHAAWLPTDGEKVNAMTAAGIAREVLPRRLYRGALGGLFRYFPHNLPVAADDERATFVFVHVEDETESAVRRWGVQHAALWSSLAAAGRAVEVVVVGRDPVRLAAAGRGGRPLDAGACSAGCGAGGDGRVAVRAGAPRRGTGVDPGGAGSRGRRRPEPLRRSERRPRADARPGDCRGRRVCPHEAGDHDWPHVAVSESAGRMVDTGRLTRPVGQARGRC